MCNKVSNTISAFSLTILNVISYIILEDLSTIWMMVWIVGILLLVRCLPMCRGYENMWVFLLTFFCSIAGNVKTVYYLWLLGIIEPGIPIIGDIIAIVEYNLILLTVEELVLGVITRFIWRRQYNITA